MQVAGPAGELIYFTEVSGEVPGFTLPTATQQVNQCFVMINAVTAIETSIDFYARLLGCAGPHGNGGTGIDFIAQQWAR